MCIVLTFGCQKSATNADAPSPPSPLVPTGMAEMRVGSAAFHLEISRVYERYGDYKSALDHLSQAASMAQGPAHFVQVHSALGRVKEAAGDRDGAIEELEQAFAKMNESGAVAPAPPIAAPLGGPEGNDLLLGLARLHAQKGNRERARALCERGLSVAIEPWQREQLYRLLIEVDRKSGILEKEIAAKEKTLDEAAPDESALRFLAVALSFDGMQPPPAMGGAQGNLQTISKTLLRVYERLHELHPDDLQLRQTLQSLLQRAGRTEDAARLAAQPAPQTPMDCETPPRVSATLRAAADAIRVRTFAGQKDKALAETGKIADFAKEEGPAAYLVAAQLYLDQGAADRATRLLERANQESRSREERRQVAFALERAVARGGHAGDLKALHERWKTSDDPCLRLTATWRKQPQGMMAVAPPAVSPP
jgi:tetratricopeptide (TPR) repeat protein